MIRDNSPVFELKFKIFLFNLLLIFGVLSLAAHFSIQRTRADFQEDVGLRFESLVKALEPVLFELILDRDKNTLDAVARKLTSVEIPGNDIVSVVILDSQLAVLASSDQAFSVGLESMANSLSSGDRVPGTMPVEPSTMARAPAFIKQSPIRLSGGTDHSGFIRIGISTTQLDKRLGILVKQHLIVFFMVSLIGFLAAVVLANIIRRPIDALVEATGRISDGDMGTVIQNSGKDEIGHLIFSFNRMVDTLRRHLEEGRTENKRLDRRVFELSTLHQAARMINSVLNLDRLFELIVDTTIQVLGGVKRCSIMLVDPKKTEFIVQNAKGLDVGLLPNSRRVPITQGVAGRVFETGEPVLINDVPTESDSRVLENAQVVRSSICVPLKCNDEVIGIISASNKISGEPFTQNDLNLLETLSSQAGIAIKNAKLYQALDRKIFELATLHEVGKSLSMVLDIETLLGLIMEMTARVLGGVKSSSLILFDEQTGNLVVKVHKGISQESVQKPIQVGQGIAGKVFETGEPILINNLASSGMVDGPEAEGGAVLVPLAGAGRKSSLCVPLKVKERCIGVLAVSDKLSEESFDENDLDMLNTLASQIAVTLNNARLYEDLEASYLAAVSALANSLDAKDTYTRGHSDRVAWYSVEIGRQMNLPSEEIKNLHIGALLHDIGKIGISENIINKPSRLTAEEFELIKTHPVRGANIIEPAKFLEKKLPLIKYHHERIDGQGYPEGLHGEEIPLLARIVCVADSYDAMTSVRAYRNPMSREAAIQELVKFSGAQFDSKVVVAFIEVLRNEAKMAEFEEKMNNGKNLEGK
jgi:HD-GYP domain-containing protein (c-di-GMP phosphodiesterase class II)/HAMP domain-containing protein